MGFGGEVPGVEGAAHAVFATGAGGAFFIVFGSVVAERFEFVFPDIGEASFVDVTLDDAGLGSVDVEASEYVACYCDAGNGDSCHAEEVPVSYLALVVNSKEVAAAIAYRIVVCSLFTDEFHYLFHYQAS